MLNRRGILSIAALFAAVAALRTTAGQTANSSGNPPPERAKKLAIGEEEAKRMLVLMDRDKNGKVSKQEFMSFMEEEFERLDKNKDGELDVKELTETRVRIGGAIHR